MGLYDNLGDMSEILDNFVIETYEQIEQLNQDLLLIEYDNDPEVVNRIFRVFHTIKGTSGFLSFDICMDLAHISEDLLNKVRSGELSPSSEIVDVLLDSSDWFKMFIKDVEARVDRAYDNTDIQNKISALLQKEAVKSPTLDAHEPVVGNDEPQGDEIIAGFPKELITEFISESHELIETVGNELMSLEIEPDNDSIINEIFRVFHTLKGNSALVGLEQMSEMAHKSEDVLTMIREKKLEVEADLIDTLLEVVDQLRMAMEELRHGTIISLLPPRLMGKLGEYLGDLPQILGPESEPTKELVEKPHSGDTPAKKIPTNKRRVEQTIRVDVNRVENLMNVAGELVLEKNRLARISQTIKTAHPGATDLGDLESLNNSLGYITTEIQESVMRMRMLPIDNVFKKFPRMVRDLSKGKKKSIELKISGAETELDRSVIEAIGDPMIHLLRNAIDHGIESPEKRQENGKDGKGTIWLDAFQEGNQIVIKIRDDGGGLPTERILAKAIEKNIVSSVEAQKLDEASIHNLIFKPGFSTAEVVTDISGRGVGLDVVYTNITRLNGSVSVQSEPQVGSTFTIKLPLTLTIMTGMVVGVHAETYILPLTGISETIRLNPETISKVKGQEFLTLRKSVFPLIYLDALFGVPKGPEEPSQKYVIIVNIADKRLGLVVTRFLGQEETVVKPLGPALGKVQYLAGATLRGDGKVSLIVDLVQLFNSGKPFERAMA